MLWLISPHPASCPKILGGQGCNYSRATWPESSISESSLCVTGKITRGAGRVAPLEQFAWAVFTPPDRSGPSRWPGSGWGDASVSGDLLELGAPSGHAHHWAPQRSTQPYPLDLVVGPTASSFSATEAVLDFFDAS